MSQLIPISAVIADRSYRIKIKQEDEETVRRTLKTLNDQILDYKTQFAGKDMQDYISMVLISYATLQNAGVSAPADESELAKKLDNMEKLLDDAIG